MSSVEQCVRGKEEEEEEERSKAKTQEKKKKASQSFSSFPLQPTPLSPSQASLSLPQCNNLHLETVGPHFDGGEEWG